MSTSVLRALPGNHDIKKTTHQVFSINDPMYKQKLYLVNTNTSPSDETHSMRSTVAQLVDWLQSLKQYFTNVPYHILVASLTLMTLFFKTEPLE